MTPRVTVTGTYRSGTTLVERLLDQHPAAAIASQPLPHLWLAAKRAYLVTRGVERPLPLGPLFRDPDHDPDALTAFLATWPHDPKATLDQTLATQAGFSGALTPQAADLPARVPADLPPGLDALVSWCYLTLARLTGRSEARLVGAKEIVVDEFVPTLLEYGHHVVLVVRDLRAVVASSLHGTARDYVGDARPTLFTIRTWRRTVAMALAHRAHSRCHILRYEDLVDAPEGIATVWKALGLEPSHAPRLDPSALRDQYGHPWMANTSFGRQPTGGTHSVERALEVLDPGTLDYVTAAAAPELHALGYLDVVPPDPERALRAFAEPVPVSPRGLDPAFSTSEDAIAEELRRLELVERELDRRTAREWFIMPEAHRVMREALRSGAPVLG